jgi:hypothetical protein
MLQIKRIGERFSNKYFEPKNLNHPKIKYVERE